MIICFPREILFIYNLWYLKKYLKKIIDRKIAHYICALGDDSKMIRSRVFLQHKLITWSNFYQLYNWNYQDNPKLVHCLTTSQRLSGTTANKCCCSLFSYSQFVFHCNDTRLFGAKNLLVWKHFNYVTNHLILLCTKVCENNEIQLVDLLTFTY